MSNVSAQKAFEFPPYGRMIFEWESLIEGEGSPPRDWSLPKQEWIAWRANLISMLADILWPTYDQKANSWNGASRPKMLELTLADFELFKTLQPLLASNVDLPDGPVSNYDLFSLEDEADAVESVTKYTINRSLDASLTLYLSGAISDRRIRFLSDAYIKGLAGKSGNCDLELKRFFQRPRPYQVSYMMGMDWFTHRHAKSAVTPAMISGHCFEACMGGFACFERAKSAGYSPDILSLIAQHTVDAGDRRVFAGVHYASDNISSWITALSLAPHVGVSREACGWLWDGIQEMSAVYKELRAHVESVSNSPFSESFTALANLGESRS